MLNKKKIKVLFSTLSICLICLFVSSTAFAAIMETEPNDTMETANQYTIGHVFLGKISSSTDHDFLEFSTGVDGIINILLLPQSVETADHDIWIWDMTANEFIFQENTINPGKQERISFQGIASHWYLVAIAADKGADHYYQFLATQ